jgi:hypothetical protein
MVNTGVMSGGPMAWRNWQAWRQSEESQPTPSADPAEGVQVELGKPNIPRMYETALYGDASVVGLATGLGPYSVLNTIHHARAATGQAGAGLFLILRVEDHLKYLAPDPGTLSTDTSNFTGGNVDDEMASLIALALGMRCRAGGPIRFWYPERSDPLGQPLEFDHYPPVLLPSRRPIVPRLRTQKSLDEAHELLQTYGYLAADDAVALARASRMYAQALWVADADPNLAWILLVGALETAAVHGGDGPRLSYLQRVEQGWPELAEILHEVDQSQADRIAKMLATTTRATRRFLDFMTRFDPGPPEERPTWGRVEWSELRDHLALIYKYRSAALHAGEPFPPPMSEAPFVGDDEIASEIPLGLGAWSLGGAWQIEHTPMLLATFEYIARGALLAWWKQLHQQSR